MPRSTTVWAAALVLASFSGSGPLLTTAEAMPAPGPQETQGRPRYYFPRHVKRQIVTNTTAPALPTSSPAVLSSTSSEQLESRQVPNKASSFLESLFGRPGSSSSSSGEGDLASTVTSIQEIIVTPVPDRSNPGPAGTGNVRQSTPSNPGPVRPPQPASSAPISSAPSQPEQEPEPVPAPPSSSSVARDTPANSPILGTGSRPVNPPASPSTSPSSEANLLSSFLGGVFASTGVLPSSAIQPTPSPESPSSTFLGPFIVPGQSSSPSSAVVQPTPTPSQNLVGGLLSSILDSPEPTPTPQVGSTGVLPSSILSPTSAAAVPSSDTPLIVVSSTGGIVVGITTALGTGAPTPTPVISSDAIPTSEAASPSAPPLNLPSILSSLVSEVSGVLPSGSAGPTAPVTPSPAPTPSGVLPPLVSSLVADVSSLLSSAVPDLPASALPSIASSIILESPLPSASAPIIPPASSLVSSFLSEISSGAVPTASGDVTTPGTPVIVPSETLSVAPTPSVSAGITPSNSADVPGITPSATLPLSGSVGSGVVPTPTPSETGSVSIPASEVPIPSGLPSSVPLVVPSGGNATASEVPATSAPVSIDSATIPFPTPSVFSRPTPVQSQRPIGSDSATSMIIGSIIIQESTSNPAPSPTSNGIPSTLPRVIAPPGGMPNEVSTQDTFMGQVCFKWQLNYPFVAQNDGGNQIFHYLPKAIANGLNISDSDVHNMGLRPLDTTKYQGFITTLAYFTIPKDLQSKLQAALRNPADAFWHNKDQTVNDLTSLINTACPLAAGKVPADSSNPNQAANPAATSSGGAGDGGAIGGAIGASRPINGSAAGIATGAIVGAIAYGAAMFFVARRYRNKRIAHQRSSSVPSTGSRMTYGSIPGGAAAWMHGARNGRITPGSRGSRGSSSSQGRSVRTQQISAPVMAENSLGWN